MSMAIGSLAPWLGSKRTLAPAIAEELGPHRAFFDAFCGSMAPLLCKPPATMEVVNDLHGDLINLARVVQSAEHGPPFYRRLRRTLASEEAFLAAAAALCEPAPGGDGVDPERAYAYFLASWLGRNGVAGTTVGGPRGAGHSFCVRFTANGGQPAKRLGSAVDSIPAWRRRLRGVTILRRDGFEVLAKVDDADGVAIYVDPPYLRETRSGFQGAGGTSRYLHEFRPEDHARLAGALARFRRARVVVSYYDHPRLAELYPGWSVRRFDVNKAVANASKRGGKGDARAVEVLLVNGPLHGGSSAAPVPAGAAGDGMLFDLDADGG
jgi:DNA adenine methylase